jgi:hypothetical protein
MFVVKNSYRDDILVLDFSLINLGFLHFLGAELAILACPEDAILADQGLPALEAALRCRRLRSACAANPSDGFSKEASLNLLLALRTAEALRMECFTISKSHVLLI